MAAYGRPGAWRNVARANRITDPLRVRPGTEIFLPNLDELADFDEPATAAHANADTNAHANAAHANAADDGNR